MTEPNILCLMGPTAVGKTDLALALVEHLPCEIISVDSALVYKGMDIGSAKPSKELLARVPHRLIDIREVTQTYSAADFCADAKQAIEEIMQAGRIPLLVGGTMLYFNALQNGLAELPSANAAVRQQLAMQAAQQGWPALHQRLQQVDAAAAQQIHPNDSQRIMRALEVYELTGQSISVLQRQRQGLLYRCINLALMPDSREQLHQRIALRLDAMWQQGFVDEVEGFYAREDLHPPPPAFKALGYRHVWCYLDGQYTYAQMQERALVATRQFAKRQLTWLRSWPAIHMLSGKLQQDLSFIQDCLGEF